MSTPFSDISKLMQLEMQQSDLYKEGKINTDIALDIISDLILIGASVDFATCNKKLELNTPYKDEKINSIIDIDKNTLSIDITNIDITMRNNIVLYVNDVEQTDFTYKIDNTLNTCDVSYNFKANDNVEVVFIFEGEFQEDLSFREKYIIALSAYYHNLNGKIQEENKLIKQLGDKDYKIVRGNFKDDLLALKNSVWDNLRTYIIAYERQTSTVEDLM
jgi:hypothetical protein